MIVVIEERCQQRGAATFLSPQKRRICPTVSGDRNVAAPCFCRPCRFEADDQLTNLLNGENEL